MKWKIYNPTFKYEKMYNDLGGPWAGHKYFGYDLIRNFKPMKVVELGTHLGCSLFSLAQAAQDGQIKTKIDAIDTWLGDKHSSLYGENILSRVQEIKKACYPKVNINLIRKTFDQTAKDYPNNSIDLLHIDGLHAYKAVKHDYETWLPKVRQNGIILLHDTAVKTWGFGVYKLFDQIKKNFKTIEFAHSYGLGIVFKNPQMYSMLEQIVSCLQLYYSLKSDKIQLEWNLDKQSLLLIGYKNQLDHIKSAKAYKFWQFYNHNIKKLLLHFSQGQTLVSKKYQ